MKRQIKVFMKCNLQVGCSLGNLKSIRDFVRQNLEGYACSPDCLDEIVLALDEMCSNIMIHAHQCDPEHLLDVSIDASDGKQIVFEISDQGKLFDINSFNAPELENLISEKRKGGLGIRLVRTIMSSIDYFERDNRTVCRLVKKIG